MAKWDKDGAISFSYCADMCGAYGCTISENSYIGCSQYLLVKAVKEKQSLMVKNIVWECVGHPLLLEEGTAALVGWVKNLTAYVVKNIS